MPVTVAAGIPWASAARAAAAGLAAGSDSMMPKINDGVQHPVRRPGAGGILTARRGPAGRGVNFESEAGLKLELEAAQPAQWRRIRALGCLAALAT